LYILRIKTTISYKLPNDGEKHIRGNPLHTKYPCWFAQKWIFIPYSACESTVGMEAHPKEKIHACNSIDRGQIITGLSKNNYA
jgi:hypothetical protein